MKGKLKSVGRVAMALVLAVSLGLVMAAPAQPVLAQDEESSYAGYRLGEVDGNDEVTWSKVALHSGSYSVLLDKGTGADGSTHVDFALDGTITLAEFQADITAGTPEWSFWHNTPASPANWAQFELRFTDLTSDGWLELTAVGLQNFTGSGDWAEEVLEGTTPAGFGGNTPDGSSVFKWDSLTQLSGIEAAINSAVQMPLTMCLPEFVLSCGRLATEPAKLTT